MTQFEEDKAMQAELRAETTRAGKALDAIPGVGSGPMGLTPDAIKFSPEYRAAKAAFDSAFQRERAFNGYMRDCWSREMAQERRQKRAARATH